MDSPAYYIQQNDIIYVEPNSARIGQSSINENTFKSAGFWTSLTSIAISIATLVVTLTR
jgi:polysaccharide export outer membrane protein